MPICHVRVSWIRDRANGIRIPSEVVWEELGTDAFSEQVGIAFENGVQRHLAQQLIANKSVRAARRRPRIGGRDVVYGGSDLGETVGAEDRGAGPVIFAGVFEN